MKQFRIKRIHVALVGLVLSVGVVVLFLFMFVKPLQKEIGKREAAIEKLTSTIIRAQSAKDDLKKAQDKEIEVGATFERYQKAHMPTFPYKGDDLASMMDMWDFGGKETMLMARWFASTGAQVSGYSFPDWGFDIPTQRLNAAALPALTWNLTVTVKDYADLQRWLKTIPNAPRLMVLQSVTIPGGRAPLQPLTANVTVTVYEWLQGPGAGAPVAGGGGGLGAGGGGSRRAGGGAAGAGRGNRMNNVGGMG